jgi:hypothetical protein
MRTTSWACGLTLIFCAVGAAKAETPTAFPVMAPLAQYRLATVSEEVALARSAAPATISADAKVLALGEHGYETAVEGKNGFVCLVERSWAAGVEDDQFWNPKIRAPMCLNAEAARTLLPSYIERTAWALAGKSRLEMLSLTKAEVADKRFVLPGPGAMCYMMSEQGHLSDADGHWHPHLMFFVANTDEAAWGANVKGSPVYAAQGDPEPFTTFFIPVQKWSDGTSAVMESH